MSRQDGQVATTSELDPELQRRLQAMPQVSTRPIFWFALAVVIVWLAGLLPWAWQYGAWPWELSFGVEKGKAAEFGDSFGFINSLISSLALVGVIAAIWLQKQELAEQRKEMVITQWELKKSADAQDKTQQELNRQARINLQATILTALDGMERSTLHGADSSEDFECGASFVNRLRERVIIDILDPRSSDDLTGELVKQLDAWRDLTLIVSFLADVEGQVARLLRADPNYKTGEIRQKSDDHDVKVEAYEKLVQRMAEQGERVCDAMSRCIIPPEELDAWLKEATRKAATHDMSGVCERLSRLQTICETYGKEAKEARAKMFTT